MKTENLSSEPVTANSVNTVLATVIEQLDKWIIDSEKKQDVFHKMNSLSGNAGIQYFSGMAQAYWNVKQFIEVNYNQNINKNGK